MTTALQTTPETPTPQPTREPVRTAPGTELSLLLDVGSAWTKAALVGRAGGRWRIVTGTAQPTSWGEPALVEDLVARLAPHADARLSRRLALLVREAPRITCRSPRRAGRLAVVADTAADQASAEVLARRNGWEVVAGVAADDRRSESERHARLRDVRADVWLVIAGSGLPPTQAPVWGSAAAARGRSNGPLLLVAPEELTEPFSRLFGVEPEWVGSSIDAGLSSALLARLAQSAGVGGPRALAPIAFGRAMHALAVGLGLRVMGVDVGASWLAWATANPSGASDTAILTGVGGPIPAESRDAAELLPPESDEFAIGDAMANLAARPASIPASALEAAISQAMATDRLAAARRIMGSIPPIDLLVGGGRLLAGATHPADAALVMLDGLRPAGVTQLALDPWGICGPLGALPGHDVDEGMETLRDDLLVPLGTTVVTHGGRPGQVAFRARLHRPGWPDSLRVEVRTGTITVLPVERGVSGDLMIELERGVTLGVEHRGRRMQSAVTGGALGIILDARGDPIELPTRPGDARTVIQAWREALRREGRTAAG